MKVLFQSAVPLQWFSAVGKSVVFVAAMTLVFGVIYPAAVTGVSLLFPELRAGSIIEANGRPSASELIGQDYWATDLFAGRPSATVPPYDAAQGRATNLAPGNPQFKKRLKEAIAAWQARTGQKTLPPPDLITMSASGLDPHVSVAGALWQAPFVARKTGLTEAELKALIDEVSEVGLFSGRRFVNVVKLNHRVAALRRLPPENAP